MSDFLFFILETILTMHTLVIDKDQVWNIIQHDLQTFKDVIKTLIADMDLSSKENLIQSFSEDYKYLDFIIEMLHKL